MNIKYLISTVMTLLAVLIPHNLTASERGSNNTKAVVESHTDDITTKAPAKTSPKKTVIAKSDTAAAPTKKPVKSTPQVTPKKIKNNNGKFLPTEKISEDLSVSFPIDI